MQLWNKDEGILLLEALVDHLILKKEDAKNVLEYLKRNIK